MPATPASAVVSAHPALPGAWSRAAHLADRVIPHLPVRQRVLSVPKRLPYHLKRDPSIQNTVLRNAHLHFS